MGIKKIFYRCVGIALLTVSIFFAGISGEPQKVSAVERNIVIVDVTEDNITSAIQDSLDEARELGTPGYPCKVKIPAGTYTLTDTLKIYSNTTLEMTGVVLKRGKTSQGNNVTVMLRTGRLSEAKNPESNGLKGGYEDFINITLKGGEWDGQYLGDSGMIRMCHGKNIVLDGVTVKNNYNSHHVEMAAVDGLTVKNCTFTGHKEEAGSKTNKEALQLDIMQEDHLSGFYQYDGTPMKNVLIQNNTFSDVFRGFGTHSAILGSYFEDIKIIGNTFKNIKGVAVATSGYRNCVISDNSMQNVGGGVLFRSLTDNGRQVYDINSRGNIKNDCASIISNNLISTVKTEKSPTPVGIEADGFKCNNKTGVVPAGDYYVGNIKIHNNTISSTGVGIKLDNVKSSFVTENHIKSSDTKLSRRNGIALYNGSNKNNISKNEVKNVTQNGISLENSSNNAVGKNLISNSHECGIKLLKNAKANKIDSNTIISSRLNGIYVTDSSNASGIINNKVFKSQKHGIAIYAESFAGKIKSNSIKEAKEYAICIDTNCSAKIYWNSMTKNKRADIVVRNGKNYKCGNLKKPSSVKVSNLQKGKVKVKWKKVSEISGYQIILSRSKDFSSNCKYFTVNNLRSTGKIIGGLDKKKNYYLKVRCYKKVGKTTIYGTYSLAKHIVVK